MPQITGVDGCPGGWLCVTLDTNSGAFRVFLFRLAAELLAHDPFIQVMTIDMPIGLASTGRRRCDELARNLLGNRHVCVQNAPIRPALYAPSRLAASAVTQATVNRQVGSNEWALYPKIINLDLAITPLHQRWCFEIHPEVSFHGWNNGVPIKDEKNSDPGRQAREALIDAAWPNAAPGLAREYAAAGHQPRALRYGRSKRCVRGSVDGTQDSSGAGPAYPRCPRD